MKRNLGSILAAVVLCAGGFALAATGPAQGDLAAEVAKLRAEVDDLKRQLGSGQDIASARADMVEMKKALETTIDYLQAQADVSAKLIDTIEQSVVMGFTQGINFSSRELLVAAWYEYYGTLTQFDLGRPEEEPKAPGANGGNGTGGNGNGGQKKGY